MRLVPAAIALITGLVTVQVAAGASPHFNYMLHCQGCHLPDGTATPGIIPPLVGAAQFLSADGGREYLVQVPGVALATISDEELAALVNWMLETFSPGEIPDDFVPYTPAEVAEFRQRPLVDVDTVRKAIIGEAYYD